MARSNAPVPPTQTPPLPPIDWGAVQDELDQGSGSNWLLLSKNPNVRLRLLQAPGDARPYMPVETEYQGKSRVKYLMFCTEADNGPVKVVVLTKTAFRAIVALLTNGWELFDPQTGMPVIISKFSTGGRTSYSVTPAGAKASPVRDTVIEELATMSLDQAYEDFMEWQEFMANRRGDDSASEE